MKQNDTILVSIDYSNEDIPVLVVGRKTPGEVCYIINAFQGDVAEDIYKKLVTKIERGDGNGKS